MIKFCFLLCEHVYINTAFILKGCRVLMKRAFLINVSVYEVFKLLSLGTMKVWQP